MSIIIFLIILSVLILVHELGHFWVAKRFGIRVDEFGLGYPPRAAKLFSWRGTDFTLNWLPFGGFVKIFGENPTEEEQGKPEENFQKKNRGIQAAVLVAGVVCNFLFAWFLITVGFMGGVAAPLGVSLPVENPQIMVTNVLPGSPAAEAGVKTGDVIIGLSRGSESAELSPEEAAKFIGASDDPVTFKIKRGNEISEKLVDPEPGIVADKPAVGIGMEFFGTVKLNPVKALWHGLLVTSELTWLTAKAIVNFIAESILGKADLSQVAGPVGIVGMVGDVRELGFSFLLTFTAVISINLAIINLVPFPALDGGRLLFVAIEAIRRKPIPPVIFNAVNTIGFFLLILLMVLITVRDIKHII